MLAISEYASPSCLLRTNTSLHFSGSLAMAAFTADSVSLFSRLFDGFASWADGISSSADDTWWEFLVLNEVDSLVSGGSEQVRLHRPFRIPAFSVRPNSNENVLDEVLHVIPRMGHPKSETAETAVICMVYFFDRGLVACPYTFDKIPFRAGWDRS